MNGSGLRKKIGLAALAAVILLSLPLLAGFFGRLHPAFDSFAHFRIHLAVLMALTALLLIGSRLFLEGVVAIALATGAIATTTKSIDLPLLGSTRAQASAGQPVYRLLQLNLLHNNPEPNRVLSLIGRIRPDVITLNEVSAMWAGKLELLQAAYPYRILCPFPNGVWGVAILSSRPFVRDAEAKCYDRGSLAIAPIDFGGRAVDVATLHLGWPWPFHQPRQIAALAAPLASLSDTALLAGDMNATPWSAAVSRVAELGGLELMRSVGPTWQSRWMPQFMQAAGLPIDQVFQRGVTIHNARTLEAVGSDHLPVLVEFSLPLRNPKPDEDAETATAWLGK
ncbi:MAG: endonuclease/exonuclease/phosphatase family protein [Pseudaminobacter sp.]